MFNFRLLLQVVFTVLLCSSVASKGFAEDVQATTTTSSSGPRKQLATIIFTGLGGAVLGLSTLSFYGRPQDYMANIAIGFAAGIIVGTIYVTFKTATTNDFSTAIEGDKNSRGFADVARYSFGTAPTVQLGFQF